MTVEQVLLPDNKNNMNFLNSVMKTNFRRFILTDRWEMFLNRCRFTTSSRESMCINTRKKVFMNEGQYYRREVTGLDSKTTVICPFLLFTQLAASFC